MAPPPSTPPPLLNPTIPPLLNPTTPFLFIVLRLAEPMFLAAFLLITNSPGVRRAGTVSEPEIPPPAAFLVVFLVATVLASLYLSNLDLSNFNLLSTTFRVSASKPNFLILSLAPSSSLILCLAIFLLSTVGVCFVI